MADIKLWGATFPDVPKVLLPTATDGTAEFYEVSGSQTVTDNGTYDVKSMSEMVVNVSGGGGDSKEDGIIDRTISGVYTNNRVTTIGIYAFQECNNLTEANFPNATNIEVAAFRSCRSLTKVNFPNATSFGSYVFRDCIKLAEVNFPNATIIGNYMFYGCRMLSEVYLLGSSVASLVNSNAFGNTPMSNSTYLGHFGSIYVPASLANSYKTATNWSVYSSRITAYVE